MDAGRLGRFQKCLLVDSRARDHCSFYPPDQRKLDSYVCFYLVLSLKIIGLLKDDQRRCLKNCADIVDQETHVLLE